MHAMSGRVAPPPSPGRAVRRPRQGAPNVVFIVLAEVGEADLGCYGSEVATPAIDRLAPNGLLYTGFHTTAMCSPTRACLLTGRNHHSVGMGIIAEWSTGYPAYRGRITPRAATLAEVLRDQGYNTLALGKWHLMPQSDATACGPFRPELRPRRRLAGKRHLRPAVRLQRHAAAADRRAGRRGPARLRRRVARVPGRGVTQEGPSSSPRLM